MPKYAEGKYLILQFDAYGSRVGHSELAQEQNLIGAVAEARELVNSGQAATTAVVRVVYNTIDDRGRYESREAVR